MEDGNAKGPLTQEHIYEELLVMMTDDDIAVMLPNRITNLS
jgi:hypothetical protein